MEIRELVSYTGWTCSTETNVRVFLATSLTPPEFHLCNVSTPITAPKNTSEMNSLMMTLLCSGSVMQTLDRIKFTLPFKNLV
jgi:hypothetical protein